MNIEEYISSGIIEAYVLGLCSQSEKLEVEELRNKFPELENAIIEFEVNLEKKLGEEFVSPTRETDIAILEKLDSLSAPVVNIRSGGNRGNRNSRIRFAVAAAILFIIAGSYFVFSLLRQNNRLRDELALLKNNPESLPGSDYEIMKNPGITPVALYGVGIHAICRCTMFWDKQTGKGYIMIHHLPKSGKRGSYRLWAEVGEQPVNIGILDDEIRGRFIEIKDIPQNAKSFMVTMEISGEATVPSEQVYLRGSI